MKKFLSVVILLSVLLVLYLNREKIIVFLIRTVRNDVVQELTYKNEYARDYKYEYVQVTNNFNVESKNHLFNVYYTILNSGIGEFSFFCDDKYESCIDDVIYLADNQQSLSTLNGFVHPFNSFSSIETIYDTLGKVTLRINKAYTSGQIDAINKKVDYIMNNVVKNKTDIKETIKEVHDYIINNTEYDIEKSDRNITRYHSTIAYGPLIEGYAVCGGYTDAMAIVLDRYKVKNYSVISENHIWNAIYLDNKWLHLDLTWDDPITDNGKDILDYSYFLIDTKQLFEIENEQHNFDFNIFKEVAL